jgi:hypothetical protein
MEADYSGGQSSPWAVAPRGRTGRIKIKIKVPNSKYNRNLLSAFEAQTSRETDRLPHYAFTYQICAEECTISRTEQNKQRDPHGSSLSVRMTALDVGTGEWVSQTNPYLYMRSGRAVTLILFMIQHSVRSNLITLLL